LPVRRDGGRVGIGMTWRNRRALRLFQ
jgi:hypothetical protein